MASANGEGDAHCYRRPGFELRHRLNAVLLIRGEAGLDPLCIEARKQCIVELRQIDWLCRIAHANALPATFMCRLRADCNGTHRHAYCADED
jgi:hypothetical protein